MRYNLVVRNLLRLLILVPTFALCVACGEDPNTGDNDLPDTEQTPDEGENDQNDGLEVVGGKVRFFLAEHSEGVRTKVNIGTRSWSTSKVVVNGVTYSVAMDEQQRPYVDVDEDEESIYEAVLLASGSTSCYGSTPYADIRLPYSQFYHTQSSVLKTFPMYASYSKENGNRLTFVDGYAVVMLQLKGSAKISSVKVDNLKDGAVAGISKFDKQSGRYVVTKGMDFAVLNCTNNGDFVQLRTTEATNLCVMIAPGSYPQGLKVSVCDSERLAKFYAIEPATFEAGDVYTISGEYQPESDLTFYEGFDNFVWGGDVMAGTSGYGFAPTDESMGISSGTSLTGYEAAFTEVAWNNPGSGFMQPNSWSKVSGKTVGEVHQMSDSYIKSRNIGDMHYLYRVQEHPGYIAIGAATSDRGIISTHTMRGTKSVGDVKVTIRFALQTNFDGDLLLQVQRGGVITSAKLNGAEYANEKNVSYEKTVSKLIIKNKNLPVPGMEGAAKSWHKLEVIVSGATDGTELYFADNISDEGTHGIYLDSIEGRQVNEWGKKDGTLRVLLWNILYGMWTDQHNNYDNFVAWVQKYNPDVCVWCESETIYEDDPAKATMPEDERYLPNNWDKLAARFGHAYTAKSGDCGNFSQTITSKYPITTVQALVDTDVADKILSRGAGHYTINVEGHKVNFVSLHFWPSAHAYGVAKADQEASAAKNEGDYYRQYEARYLVAQTVNNPAYANETNWVMLGDTNARSRVDNWYYGYDENSTAFLTHDVIRNDTNLKDVIGDRYPAHHYFTSYTTSSRIDFIYASPAMYNRIQNSIIVIDDWNDCHKNGNSRDSYAPSDHRPVLVDFLMK